MLEIIPGSYLTVTPYGAWRAVARADESVDRRILLAVLRESMSPLLGPETLGSWAGEADPAEALDALLRLQEGACLEAWTSPRSAPFGTLESTLPKLLGTLSDSGQAVLADSMGFCLGMAGHPGETGEALAALGADILARASYRRISSSNPASMNWPTNSPPPMTHTSPPFAEARICAQASLTSPEVKRRFAPGTCRCCRLVKTHVGRSP